MEAVRTMEKDFGIEGKLKKRRLYAEQVTEPYATATQAAELSLLTE